MPIGKKICPSCEAENGTRAKACVSCHVEFTAKKKKKKGKKVVTLKEIVRKHVNVKTSGSLEYRHVLSTLALLETMVDFEDNEQAQAALNAHKEALEIAMGKG